MCSFFAELPSGCRVAHWWAIFGLVPPRGGVAPARGSIPLCGGPPPNFPQACETCRPGGGARGLTMAALPKQAYTLARMLSFTPGSLHMSCVAFVGLKFVVPGWCPGPDDGSLAETNSNCHGQELMESYTRFVPRALSYAHLGDSFLPLCMRKRPPKKGP